MSIYPGDLSVPSFSFLGLVLGGRWGVSTCSSLLYCSFSAVISFFPTVANSLFFRAGVYYFLFVCIVYLLFFLAFEHFWYDGCMFGDFL